MTAMKLNLMGLDSQRKPPHSESDQIKEVEWPAYILLRRTKWNKTKCYITVISDIYIT